jgi:hypothetical protein
MWRKPPPRSSLKFLVLTSGLIRTCTRTQHRGTRTQFSTDVSEPFAVNDYLCDVSACLLSRGLEQEYQYRPEHEYDWDQRIEGQNDLRKDAPRIFFGRQMIACPN